MSNKSLDNENESKAAGHHGHPKPVYDDINIPVVVLLGVLASILTFVSICFVQGLFYQWEYSIVQKDWKDRTLTAQEQIIADQRALRDGFYETGSGAIYTSVDVSAKKLIRQHGKNQPPSTGETSDQSDSRNNGAGQTAGSQKTQKSKPVPPGPDSDQPVKNQWRQNPS